VRVYLLKPKTPCACHVNKSLKLKSSETKYTLKSRPAMLPDLRVLQAFDCVQRLRSFRLAAEHLGVSISAISQSVQQLEVLLGQALFDRSRRPIELTKFGTRYQPLVHALIESALEFKVSCNELTQHRHREIRVGCVDSFAATVGPELVKSLSGCAGNVIMHSGITNQIIRQLHQQDIDIAICTDPMHHETGLKVKALFDESWVLAVPKSEILPDQVSWQTLKNLSAKLPFIRYSQRSMIGSQIDRFITHAGIHAPRRFEFDSTDSLLSLVSGGIGWALTSPLCLMQSQHQALASKIAILPSSALGSRTFYLICHSGANELLSQQLMSVTRQVLNYKTLPLIKKYWPLLQSSLVVSKQTF